jgi:Beta/Gamma crystallin.
VRKFIFLLLFILSCSTVCFADQPTQVNHGRYVMYQHPTFRGDQFILDTQTGKAWRLVKTKDDTTVWEEMFFDCYNSDRTYSGLYVNPR